MPRSMEINHAVSITERGERKIQVVSDTRKNEKVTNMRIGVQKYS